jgi:hypothetical protein
MTEVLRSTLNIPPTVTRVFQYRVTCGRNHFASS